MKKSFLLIFFLCLLSSLGYAATISGVVINVSTSIPVANQVVTVSDTTGTVYLLKDTTDPMGIYSVTLPSTLTSGATVMVSTMSCGSVMNQYKSYLASDMTVNMAVCATPTPLTLHGEVKLNGGGTANLGLAKVYVIRKQYDPIIMDTTLTAIDSITTSSAGGYFCKTYSSIPSGVLLMKAVLAPSHPNYSSQIPTYSFSSLNWNTATPLNAGYFNTATNADIFMIAGVNPGGPGFIGGSVLLGANKSAAVGDPLTGRTLILTTSTGQAVATVRSDASGHFQFPAVPLGSYKIFGDAWGKSNPPLSFTLSAANKSINNIIFEESSKKFEGRLGGVGVGNGPAALSGLAIYPNPVTDRIQISGLSAIDGSKTLVLTDVSGAVLFRQTIEGNVAPTLPAADLATGIYLLKVQTSQGSASFKIVK